LMLAGRVEDPVVLEVSVRDQRTELEDGFGSVESPAGAGDVEAVGDQVSAGAFDGAGGDRPAGCEGGVVVELVEVAGEVAVACGDCLAAGGGKLFGCGLRAAARSACPARIAVSLSATQVSAARLPGGWKACAAVQQYSATCTKSSRTCTDTSRRAASTWIRSS
jgi:hypothetical protein